MLTLEAHRHTIDPKTLGRTSPGRMNPQVTGDGPYRIVDAATGDLIVAVGRLDPTELAAFRQAATGYATATNTTYRASGIRNRSRIFGYMGASVTMRRDGCRACGGAADAPDDHAGIVGVAPALARVFEETAPEQAQAAWAAAGEVAEEWRIEGSPWTSGVLNVSSAMPYHRDGNNLPGVWSAMVVLRDRMGGGHLHLPEWGIVLPCRDGDVVIFDGPQWWHGVSELRPKDGQAVRLTAVFYAVAAMRNCADDEVNRTQASRTSREAGIARGLPHELAAGMDFRLPEHRREVFHRFYDFHLEHRAHPGAVYYLLPWLRDTYGWTDEEALWFAFLNGNTQNPVTSLILHRRFPTPDRADDMLAWFQGNRGALAFDTDRRHHKHHLADAVGGYLDLVDGDQADHWRRARDGGWGAMWEAANAIPTFGRLSAFSYAEYLHIFGFGTDTDTLYLDDRGGSRSHRNGLCIVLGHDELDWHESNPTFDGHYPPETVEWLEEEAGRLLREARQRLPHEPDVGYFTLESALCTFKSWHRPNRRYPNVYNDLLYDRIRAAEKAWPGEDLDVFWEARAATLPARLRLEDMPHDPGCAPVKQNHYRETGQVIMMDDRWPCFRNDLNDAIDAGTLPKRPT